ncbi:AsnC family transcriptional regulator [Sphingobium sp. CAP-1]|nr:AsnC family transcriptional regulator [Sphingobium sp. CAP-1]
MMGGASSGRSVEMQIRSGRTPLPPSLDSLDTSIIEILRINGRATNQDIAERLSVTAATVSARLQKMEEARVMRVVAVTDFAAHGYNVIIALGVKVQGRDVSDVGQALARLPQILSVNVMNGEHDIELLVALREFSEVQRFLFDHIAGVDGIAHITSGIAVDIVKFEFNVVPL